MLLKNFFRIKQFKMGNKQTLAQPNSFVSSDANNLKGQVASEQKWSEV